MVTVIIPTYNRGKIIHRAIDSVIHQTYADWELMIIDDCGQDNTEEIIKKYMADKRIHYYKTKQNMGPAGARNVGLKAGSGEFFAFLDSDDEWEENHLEECLCALDKTKYAVCSSLWSEEKDGVEYEICNYPWFKEGVKDALKFYDVKQDSKLWVFDEVFYEYILCYGFYCYMISTLVIKREVINRIGYFNEKVITNEDLEFEYRVLEEFPLVTVNRKHLIYHYGNDNLYAFVDRQKADWKEFLSNTDYVVRHSVNMEEKIKVYENIYNSIDENKHFKNKDKVRRSVRKFIFFRCLTVALTNRVMNKKKSLKYCFKSLHYIDNRKMLYLLLTFRSKKSIVQYFCFD